MKPVSSIKYWDMLSNKYMFIIGGHRQEAIHYNNKSQTLLYLYKRWPQPLNMERQQYPQWEYQSYGINKKYGVTTEKAIFEKICLWSLLSDAKS